MAVDPDSLAVARCPVTWLPDVVGAACVITGTVHIVRPVANCDRHRAGITARITAEGSGALTSNTEGDANTGLGYNALVNNTTGSNNIVVGYLAGLNLTTGDYNIDIGNQGVADEAGTIRIGDSNQTATYIAGISGQTASGGAAVYVNSDGKLGTSTSSKRFKEDIQPMDKASEAILALRPVSFRYKKEIDPKAIPQFGLVAEEVEKVNPDLVVRDKEGKPYTVRYDQVNAMLLNEFLKEHRKVEQLKNDFQTTVVQQQKEIQTLWAQLKEQAAQIQRVSAQLEVSKPTPQTAANN
jgi:endosialidase-like protein